MDYNNAKLCNVVKQLLHPESGLNLYPTPTTLNNWKNIINKEIKGWITIEIEIKTKKFFESINYGSVIPVSTPYNINSDKKTLYIIHKLFNKSILRKKVLYEYLLVLNYNTFFDIIDNHLQYDRKIYRIINHIRNKYTPGNFWIYVGINNSRLNFFKDLNKGEIIINKNFIKQYNKKINYKKINWVEFIQEITESSKEEEKEDPINIEYFCSYNEKINSKKPYRLIINELSILRLIEKVCILKNIPNNLNIFNYLKNDITHIFENLTIK